MQLSSLDYLDGDDHYWNTNLSIENRKLMISSCKKKYINRKNLFKTDNS